MRWKGNLIHSTRGKFVGDLMRVNAPVEMENLNYNHLEIINGHKFSNALKVLIDIYIINNIFFCN